MKKRILVTMGLTMGAILVVSDPSLAGNIHATGTNAAQRGPVMGALKTPTVPVEPGNSSVVTTAPDPSGSPVADRVTR